MPFTPVLSTLGGVLLALPVFHKARLTGAVTGISGIFRRTLNFQVPASLFIGGLAAAGHFLKPFFPIKDTLSTIPRPLVAIAGFCVGLGTSLANGCTSGHALCGLARLSKRSIFATAVFMVVGCLTASLTDAAAKHGTADVVWQGDMRVVAGLIAFAAVMPVVLERLCAKASGNVRTALEAALEAVFGMSFGAGLMLAGMASPAKVSSFLDVTSGKWDPSLMFVFLGGLPIAYAGFRPLTHGGKPVLKDAHVLPRGNEVGGRLIAGSTLFGVGWGLIGLCPGPAAVYAGALSSSIGIAAFGGGLVGGTLLERLM